MPTLRFEPISSVAHIEDAVNIAQIVCLFTGEFTVSDFDWDDDALVSSYVEELEDQGDFESASYYRDEIPRGIQAAQERVISDVRSILNQRLHSLGPKHSPFIIGAGDGRLLERKSLGEITGVGSAYLWFIFFDLSEGGNNYLQIDPQDYVSFRRVFDDVFEIISCYAVAGNAEQYIWHTGKHRSTLRFLKFLSRLTRKLGSGSVKDQGHLDAHQRYVNDAGVDGIGLSLHQGAIQKDAVATFIQATIQKDGRRTKVFGPGDLKRISAFFIKQPYAASLGVLSIPYNGTDIDSAHCAEQNCRYITREEIYKYLGKHRDSITGTGSRQLDAAMAKYNKVHKASAELLTIDGRLGIV